MSTRFYDTDLTDAAWAWVAPVLPAATVATRISTVPCGTVYHYFQASQILTSVGINFNLLGGKSGGGWWSGKGFRTLSKTGRGARRRGLARGCRGGGVRR